MWKRRKDRARTGPGAPLLIKLIVHEPWKERSHVLGRALMVEKYLPISHLVSDSCQFLLAFIRLLCIKYQSNFISSNLNIFSSTFCGFSISLPNKVCRLTVFTISCNFYCKCSFNSTSAIWKLIICSLWRFSGQIVESFAALQQRIHFSFWSIAKKQFPEPWRIETTS